MGEQGWDGYWFRDEHPEREVCPECLHDREEGCHEVCASWERQYPERLK